MADEFTTSETAQEAAEFYTGGQGETYTGGQGEMEGNAPNDGRVTGTNQATPDNRATRANQKEKKPHRTHAQIAGIAVRLAYLIVFIVNVQCAISFLIWPDTYAPAYELSGVEGTVAVRGMGIIFLMWNVTYPLVIISPRRFRILGIIVLVQQAIALIGEGWLLLTLPEGHLTLATGLERFVTFDAFGFLIMTVTFIWFCIADFLCRHSKAADDTDRQKSQKNTRRTKTRRTS